MIQIYHHRASSKTPDLHRKYDKATRNGIYLRLVQEYFIKGVNLFLLIQDS